MPSPNRQVLGKTLDLTLPERMAKVPAVTLFLTHSTAISGNLAASLENLRTGIEDCLPWRYSRPAGERRSSSWPQALVAIVSLLVLVSALRLGASLAFLYGWAAATLLLLWSLALDGIQPAGEKEPARETAVWCLVVVQFVSVAVIWITFYMVRLR